MLAGVTVEDELDVRDKDGRVFPVHARIRPVPPGDGIGPNMYVTVAVDISARREAEAALLRHAEAQQAVVDLGRLALKGGCLNQLCDQAVGAAARVLSGDCAQLFERLPDTQDLTLIASVGWPQERKGDRIVSNVPSSFGDGGERGRAGDRRGLASRAALSALAEAGGPRRAQQRRRAHR